MIRWLSSHTAIAHGAIGGPAFRAARALDEVGVNVITRLGRESVKMDSDVAVEIGGTLPSRDGKVVAEYVGLRAAALLLEGRGGTLSVANVRRGLSDGVVRGQDRPTVLRCTNGWLVARWRHPDELRLLEALLGKPIAAARVAEVEKAADSARLLAVGIRHRSRYQSVPNVLEAGTLNHAVSQARWKIVDWSNLWAGPWATGYLAATGADITHVEAPHRRDGYLQTRAGREVWMRFNEMKQRVLLDARVVSDRVRLERLLMGADLLVSGHTLRVLPQLGFDDEWFSRAATGLCRLSLVAYEGDREGLPGLGEHAAAIAGLLLTDAGRPRPPRPWADPLLGAWAVVIALAMRRARVRGAHVRLSLEAAASRVLTPEVGKVFLKPNLGPS